MLSVISLSRWESHRKERAIIKMLDLTVTHTLYPAFEASEVSPVHLLLARLDLLSETRRHNDGRGKTD